MSAVRTAKPASALGTASRIALAAFLAYALTGGGRIVGSDEVTMFDVADAVLHGHIAVPEGATLRGPDGRFYSKNAAGQAVLALPLVAAGEGLARAAGFQAEKAVLAARFLASFFNAIVTAIMLGVFYFVVRGFRVRPAPAFVATLLLDVTTPTWVYSKSFMAEPLEGLGLLLALGGAARAANGERGGNALCALGVFLAISAKLSMLPLALAVAAIALGVARPDPRARAGAAAAAPLLGLGAALAGHLAYNLARFGTPFETGYGAQASAGAFTTPLHVGLYGLLLSSGKGILWFAPVLALAPWGWAEMTRSRQHSPETPRHGAVVKRAALAVLAAWLIGLVLYARFQHWGGDGSFGPRYLVPLLPLAFVPVAFALDGASRLRKRIVWVLALAGLLVQIGGVSIYFGAQMREAGDYPYTLALDDPHFMEASHFNPRFSPIAGHWTMLARNLGEHLRGEMPKLGQSGAVDPRLGITPGDQAALLHALDFWWLYARYAGFAALPLAFAAFVLLGASLFALIAAYRSALAEGRA